MRLARALASAALLAFVLACTASIAAQDWLGLAPLGVVNREPDGYRSLALGFAIAGLLAAALLAANLVLGRARRTARLVRRLLVGPIALELILYGVDVLFVSRAPTSPLGGPYWETRARSGEWIPLHRAHAGSALGFRWAGELAREPRGTRLLFLGDSYTE